MKTILLTGSRGFIGTNFIERLKDTYNIIEFDKRNTDQDIRKIEQLEPVFANNHIDCVVHLAGCAGVRPSIEDPIKYIKNNLIGTTNILECMKKYDVKNIVFASSSSVYGEVDKASKEDDVKNPMSPYAWTKSAGEDLIKLYTELYGMKAVCLRFFTVFGEHQRKDLAIQKFIKAIKKGEPIEVYGDGEQRRSWTYVGDIVNGINAAIKSVGKDIDFGIFNLGGEVQTSVNEIIDMLFDIMGKKVEVIHSGERLGDVRQTYTDNTKAKEILKWCPKTSLKEGLKREIRGKHNA